MSLPWTDWQFYVVTASMLGGLWLLVRPFVSRSKRQGCPGCDGCDREPAVKPTLVAIGGRAAGRR